MRTGPLLAACATFEITIKGRGCHGAYPHLGVDPIVLAASVIQAIQLVTSGKKSALQPALITIGGIKSNTYAPNIVPDSVELTGTARYFEPELQAIIKRELENACKIAETLGGSYSLRYQEDCPALTNDKRVVGAVARQASRMLGLAAIEEAQPIMAAEDFSYLCQKLPSCYIFLGAKLADSQRMVHTSTFDIDEDALPVGAAILAASGLSLCQE